MSVEDWQNQEVMSLTSNHKKTDNFLLLAYAHKALNG